MASTSSDNAFLRSLHVLLLAAIGLAFYVAGFALLVLACGVIISSCARAQSLPLTPIDATFTGSWYDPAQSGHGLMLEVLPDHRLLALWFAFDSTGHQAWFGGVGSYSGNVATITDVAQPLGGRWVPNFDPATIVRKPWGTLTFTFSDRDHGHVDFAAAPGFGSGGMDLLRLTNTVAQSATTSPIGSPVAVLAGADGNIYFSSEPDRVFRIDTNGVLVRIAGTGVPGFSGDGGPATQAQLNFPFAYPEYLADPYDYGPMIGGLARDAAGNLYVADAYNNRVRRIDTNGIITTVVGDGRRLNAGDGGSAKQASIYWPQGVGIDPAGNLLVTSVWGPLRRVGANGIITELAAANCGAKYLGAGFCVPENIAIDASSNVYVPDGYCRVRRPKEDSGMAVTIAGDDDRPSNGSAFTCGYDGDGGPAVNAALNYPYAVATGPNGVLYIADTYNDCIRKVDANGIITTYAGRCAVGGLDGDGGPATAARLRKPFGVAADAAGNVYIADTGNERIRKVSVDGTITTIAGNGSLLTAGTIGPAFTGSWYDPAQSGHGLMLEVLPDHQMLALWFAFDPAGTGQAWFGGVGTYIEDHARIADIALPTGGRWIPNFDPDQVDRKPWGTLNFTFTDCNHGSVKFDSTLGYGSGTVNLLRLTQPLGLSCN